MGGGIDGHDQDRTREHLGTSDKAIIQYRRILRREIETVAGGQKPLMFLEPAHARSIRARRRWTASGPPRGWETYWMEVDVARRRGAPWAAAVPRETSERCIISYGGGVMFEAPSFRGWSP